MRTDAVLAKLAARAKRRRLMTPEARATAERVAWRQAFRWLQAQLAFAF